MFLKSKHIILYSLLTVLLAASFKLSAQEDFTPPSFRIEVMELPNGRLGNHCQTIVQDSSGIMWFGTQRGLHRWDGYQFKTYLNDPYESSSISKGYVEKILVAKDHTFWLASYGGGISHLDLKTEKFINFFHDPEDENSINSNFVSDIIEDKEGFIWIATQEGLCRYSPKTKTFKRFTHDPNDPESLSYNICRKLYIDSDGVLWVGTGFVWEQKQGGGLNKYDPKDGGKFIRYLHEPNNPKSLSNNKITEIFEDSKENFWIGTAGDGLHLMDRDKGEFTRLQNQPGKKSQLSAPIISDVNNQFTHTKIIFEDQRQKLWIGSSGGGIKYYDPETGYSQHFFLDDGTENSLPDNYAWDMFQSRDGTLWGCTAGPSNGKVFKIQPQNELFHIQPVTFDDNYLGFHESSDGITWFSQDEIGLIKMDAKTGDTLQYLDDPLNPVKFSFSNFPILQNTSAKFQNIDKIIEDRDRNLWLDKNIDHILIKFNPETGDYKEYHHDPNDNNSLSGTDVEDILVDKKGIVWITTNNLDLNKYDPVKDHFTHISFIENQDVVKDINVYTIANLLLANDGTIWIAGSTHFSNEKSTILVQFDPNTQLFLSEQIYLRKYSIDQSSLPLDIDGYVGSHINIIGVQEDEFGNIWVCTRYFIYKYNPSNSEIIYFDSEQFNSPYFNGFVIDEHGYMWLLGNGLIVFDPLNETKFNYGNLKNINELTFQRAIFKRSDGNILAGSHTALITFDPEEIRSNTNNAKKIKPEIKITEFNLINMQMKEAYNDRPFVSTWDQPVVHLAHDQNVFSFRFTLLDFFDPINNRHEFMLEGYDSGWRLAGLEPEVTYAKVPPGEYSFKVRGANYLGAWSDEETVKVIISPPWWNTLWAKIAFYGSLAFLIIGFYRFQLNRRLDHAEAIRLKELDTIKSQLYTNITHEFRTPLTVISGMATQVKENPKEWFAEGLKMITRNSERLLSLVNQMLDLSKLESGKMPLNLMQNDVVNYLKYLVESFHSYADSEKIQLHFHSEEKELMMDYDVEKLQQVVTNLLSNAVKFTPENGHIYISVRSENENEEAHSKNILIKVRDTGIGITEDQIEHIFDRFYQADDSMTRQSDGTGIGLALTHELVKLMDGKILVESEQDRGTEFTVILPARNEAAVTNPLDIESNLNVENIISKSNISYQKVDSDKSKSETVSQPTSKPQILLIEDNPDVVAYIASFLDNDYQIKVGKDGQEGIDMALKNVPDLIISDVMMPYKDGFEVCDTLKNDERTSHIPIIMLTAKADIQSKMEGLERGVDAYLSKPFLKEELLLRTKKLLELRQKLQQHYLSLAGFSEASQPKEVPSVEHIEDNFVIKARKVVETHLSDFDFNVEELCKELMLSHSQVHRKLSALTGFSANKFIRYVRLNKAKELLLDPELSILNVAFDTGFNDPNYFGRIFRKEFGMTPTEWRVTQIA